MLEKGLVSSVTKEGVKYFKVSPPEKFQDLLKEKEENLKLVMPRLKELAEFSKEDLSVEVYKGKEGLKFYLKDILKVNKDFFGVGFEEANFEKAVPFDLKRFFKEEAKQGIKEYIIAEEGTKFIYLEKQVSYRYLSKEFFSPAPISTYGDRTVLIIWEPLTIILIKNKALAEAFKKYHRVIWKIAKDIKR